MASCANSMPPNAGQQPRLMRGDPHGLRHAAQLPPHRRVERAREHVSLFIADSLDARHTAIVVQGELLQRDLVVLRPIHVPSSRIVAPCAVSRALLSRFGHHEALVERYKSAYCAKCDRKGKNSRSSGPFASKSTFPGKRASALESVR